MQNIFPGTKLYFSVQKYISQCKNFFPSTKTYLYSTKICFPLQKYVFQYKNIFPSTKIYFLVQKYISQYKICFPVQKFISVVSVQNQTRPSLPSTQLVTTRGISWRELIRHGCFEFRLFFLPQMRVKVEKIVLLLPQMRRPSSSCRFWECKQRQLRRPKSFTEAEIFQ